MMPMNRLPFRVRIRPALFAAMILLQASASFAQSDCPRDPQGNCAPAPPPPPLVVELKSDPPDAKVWEGTTLLGTTPIKLQNIKRGEHVFTLKKDHYDDTSQTFQIKGFGRQSYTMTMTPLPKLSVRLDGVVDSNIKALLSIDGQRVDFLPTFAHVPRGKHVIRVYAKNHVIVNRNIEIWVDKTESISLIEDVGELSVGATPDSNLFGVNVVIKSVSPAETLLPHEQELADKVAEWQPLGKTPVDKVKVRSGRYHIKLSPPECGTVIKDIETYVGRGEKIDVPAVLPRDVKEKIAASDLKRWKKLCDSGEDKRTCAALGYGYLHPEKGKPDYENARDAYTKACNASEFEGCLGLAYLDRREKVAECKKKSAKCTNDDILSVGKVSLEQEQVPSWYKPEDDICWYRHVTDDMDPTPLVYISDEEPPNPAIDLTFLAGSLPLGTTPIYAYAEISGRFYYMLESTRNFLAISGGFAIRSRALVQEDYSKNPHEFDTAFRVGYGLDIGVFLQPGSDIFFFRPAFRYTGYFNDFISSYGVSGSLGHVFGKWVLEAGAIYETMPTRIVSVDVFGTDRILADRVGRFVPFIQIARRFGL